MIQKDIIGKIIIIFIAFFIFQPFYLYSKVIDYKTIDDSKISRYNEDRIAFQLIQKSNTVDKDDSTASLLIIRDNKTYLIRDGYDDPDVMQKNLILLLRGKLTFGSQWTNKINSKPDFVRISDKRLEMLKNVNEEFVTKNFGDFYKNVRNAFLQKHVTIFLNMMQERKKNNIRVERNPVPLMLIEDSPKETKFSITVSGKTIGDTVYYAEDADGDGVTETFSVDLLDSFDWGYKSGPNIILIYNNQEEDIKKIIGKLTHYAYYGSPEEGKGILSNFPSVNDIIEEYQLEKIAIGSGK